MKIYNWDKVLQYQMANKSAYCIPGVNEYNGSKFILKEFAINQINLELVSTYEEFKRCGETEEITVVRCLIAGYLSNQEIPPIILNSEYDIIDGIHRLSALLHLKRQKVPAFIELEKQ